ncbi:MAG: CPBP family glutamic-type intramembrane protease [Planctomycetota bacterium]
MRRLVEGFKSADARCAGALLYTALMLTVLEYRFLPSRIDQAASRRGAGASLASGVEWSLACVVGYAVVPALLVRLFHGEGLGAIGYRLAGLRRHIWIYLGLYALMVPVLLFVSNRRDFLATYPFVRSARLDLGDFVAWEAAYVAQFFALEAFFRGYLLFTLERRLAWNAVFVMAVPYCMIHYHKPLPEAFGAVGAGVLLGGLALRLRSFVGGAVLHALVAVTMDVLAARKGGLL